MILLSNVKFHCCCTGWSDIDGLPWSSTTAPASRLTTPGPANIRLRSQVGLILPRQLILIESRYVGVPLLSLMGGGSLSLMGGGSLWLMGGGNLSLMGGGNQGGREQLLGWAVPARDLFTSGLTSKLFSLIFHVYMLRQLLLGTGQVGVGGAGGGGDVLDEHLHQQRGLGGVYRRVGSMQERSPPKNS